ncbi:MAG: hypothetical protein ACYTFO_04525, partial [Planctomycetota bacterium]
MNMDVIRRCAAGVLVVALLLAAGCEPEYGTRWVRWPWALPQQTDVGLSDDLLLDALAADYERYGLPMPSENAHLAILTTRPTEEGSRVAHTILFRIYPGATADHGYTAFGSVAGGGWDRHNLVWLDPREIGDGGGLWVGAGTFVGVGDLSPVEPDPQLLADPELQGMSCGNFLGGAECSNLLPMAVQAWSRGHRDFARAALARVRADEEAPWRTRLRALLAHAAWDYWSYELMFLSGDRAAALAHLEVLVDSGFGLDEDHHRSLVEDLRLTLSTPPIPADGLEGMLGTLAASWPTERDSFTLEDPPYRAIVERGFEAVPMLMSHLDDRRVAYSSVGQKGSHRRFRRVSDLARPLVSELVGLSGVDLDRLSREEIEAWWAQAQAQGEEAYLLANAAGRNCSCNGPKWILRHIALEMLNLRYPQALPELYEKVLAESPHLGTGYLAELIAKADLPPERKAEALLVGARHPGLAHRRAAIRQLLELDHPQAAALLIEEMRAIPPTPEGQYYYSPGTGVCMLACWTDDEEVWQMVLATARRVDVGQRMEIFEAMTYSHTLGDRQLERRIRLLAAFLDDATVRDMAADEAKYKWCAGDDFERLAVRDLAAMKLGDLLGMDREARRGDPDWTAQDWARFRESIRQALA